MFSDNGGPSESQMYSELRRDYSKLYENYKLLEGGLLLIRDSTYRDALTLRGIADQALQGIKR